MKSICFKSSYNLDILSFLNVMTSDEFYIDKYKDEYNRFYPLLSNEIIFGFNKIIDRIKRTNIAVVLTTAVSLIDNFNSRDIKELLAAQDEIKKNLSNSQFPENLKEGIQHLPLFSGLIIQLIEELEELGFKDFWEEKRAPLICSRIIELQDFFKISVILEHVEQYKKLQSAEINVYVCSFAHPHGTKIFRDSLIVDYIWSDNIMINTIAHELLHPPYSFKGVTKSIKQLKEIEFITAAYDNQDSQNSYTPIESFIEENIVEALGVYIAYELGFENKPYKYFKSHDGGSHVLSPYLFTYLKENEIQTYQSFEDYFTGFVQNFRNWKQYQKEIK